MSAAPSATCWGFGGGVVVATAAEDGRVRAVACLNGVGDGGRAVRATRPAADWAAMQARIAEDRRRRARTGRSELVHPWEVVPLDPVTRANVDADMYANHARFATDGVTLRSAEAYYEFRPEEAVGRISPRPVLIVHGVRNGLHPVAEARRLFAAAGEPKELIELPEAHHLDWIQPGDPQYAATVPRIVDWFRRHLAPAGAAGAPG
jgi:uncharacterized protein